MTERRTDTALRDLVILGNHLAFWAGRTPTNPAEEVELAVLSDNWDAALLKLRQQRKEIEHISL